MRRLLAAAVVLAAVLAGCTSQPAQPVEPNGTGTGSGDGGSGGNNTTRQYLPPVARMQVFDVDGALVFQSDFVADDRPQGGAVQGGGEVRLLGSESEAVDKTASITAWNWDFGDGARASGRGVSHAFPDTGGVFRVRLTVTDSHGLSDQLNVTLGVYATRTFNETVDLSGSLQVGTAVVGAGQAGVDVTTHDLVLASESQGFPVEVEGLSLTLTPGEPTSDFDLYLLDAEGEEVASSANQSPGGAESLEFGPGELSPGTYTLRVVFYAGANGSYDIGGEVVYRVVNAQVEELFGGHAH